MTMTSARLVSVGSPILFTYFVHRRFTFALAAA
jgi:hypothetical protein